MKKAVFLLYGIVAYTGFLGAFTYAAGFLANAGVPKSIDSGTEVPVNEAILVNVLLLGVFAVQHTIMARPGFKRWWTRIVPKPIERSTFVLVTSVIFAALFWQWRPLPHVVWQVTNPTATLILWCLFWSGLGIVLIASFVINHFELFGLEQVIHHALGKEPQAPRFQERSIYKVVRHPLMLGFLIAFWSTPTMTVGHLLFAAVTTAYILVAVRIEERDLVKLHGADYLEYRRRVPALVPLTRFGRRRTLARPAARPSADAA